MKLTKQKLHQLIKEELNYILEEEKIDEGLKDYALAAGIAAGSLFGGGASAAEPAQKPAVTQVAKQQSLTDTNKVAWILLHDYEVQSLKKGQKNNFDIDKEITSAKKALLSGQKLVKNKFYNEAISIATDLQAKNNKEFINLLNKFKTVSQSYN